MPPTATGLRHGSEASTGRPGAGRVPPHNLAAEESLLGAMLLSKDAITTAVEICRAQDFYKPAHGHIFDAVVSLFGEGEPADPVTVAERLRRLGLLEAVGGPAVLVTLQNSTPATSNAGRYARIIEEHAILRRLIGVAGEIAELGYGMPDDVTATVDRAESLVFEVADRRVTDTTRRLRDLLEKGLERIEALYDRNEDITGVATGFADLDQQLSGLQPSSLVIVGARPGMGKTAWALNVAAHAAVEHQVPVLFFSLEMGELEITQRLLCAEALVESQRLRNGKLLESDWPKISRAIGRLGEAPLYVDDNPNLTLMDVRAKARRLKSKEGLGLVVIDYLQLMTGRHNAETRQVEIAEMSRGLKILARELQVPVVALSQLSRTLEARQDKRPMLSDLRESGCMPAETRLLRADNGQEVTLGELVLSQERPLVWALDEDWRLVPRRLTNAFPSGIKPVFRLRLRSGLEVDATANHKFRTIDGWARLDELVPGAHLAVPRVVHAPPEPCAADPDELVLLAHLLGDGSMGPNTVRYATADPANKAAVEEAASRRFDIVIRGKRQGNTWQLWLPAPYRLTHGRRHPIRNWLEPLGLWGARSHNKFIPEHVFSLADDQLALFLRHLWATDGSITISRNGRGPVVRVYYATTSRRLADGVKRALLRLGVRSTILRARKAGSRDGWHVRIQGVVSQRAFLEQVSSHGARGEVVPEALRVLGRIKENPNVDLVPWAVHTRVRTALVDVGVTQRQLAEALGEHYCGSYLLGTERRPRRFSRGRLERTAAIVDSTELHALATSDVYWDEVVEITPIGTRPTFDATVEDCHNFIANGIVAHNSLEQDADVVVFLYRDELYNQESTDRGLAEVIVAKHRNGPTGMARLVFRNQYTRFDNMARHL